MLIGVGVAIALLWAGQRALIYFPTSDVPSPAAAGLPHAQVVTFETVDGLTLALGFYSGKLGKDIDTSTTPAIHTAERETALIAYNKKALRLGLEYFNTDNWNQVTTAAKDSMPPVGISHIGRPATYRHWRTSTTSPESSSGTTPTPPCATTTPYTPREPSGRTTSSSRTVIHGLA